MLMYVYVCMYIWEVSISLGIQKGGSKKPEEIHGNYRNYMWIEWKQKQKDQAEAFIIYTYLFISVLVALW